MTQAALNQYAKPYFNYNPEDQRASDFAQKLKADLGDITPEDADLIVNIGGDGTVLYAFHELPNKPSFALKPPGSNSALFNGHHNIESAETLVEAFNAATPFAINALRGDVKMSDGRVNTIHAFQDINVRSFNAQAVLSDMSGESLPDEHKALMGRGYVVATPMGSTALNETCGGKVVPLGHNNIVVTIDGVSNLSERERLTQADAISRIVDDNARVDITVASSAQKRMTDVAFDNKQMFPDGTIQSGDRIVIDVSERHIQSISVQIDPTHSRTLLLNQNFRTPSPFHLQR